MAKNIAPPTDEQIRAKLKELKLELDPDIAYELPNLFPKLDGWFANGPIKTKAKLIHQVEPTLERLLNKGEKVLFVSKGVQQAFFEAMFMGALWSNLINQTVFVLTNARLLMMRTNTKGKPQHAFWLIYYSEITKFYNGWFGSMQLKMADGKKVEFNGFPKADRAMMVQVFEDAMDDYRASGFEPETTQSMECLCSHCFEVVPKGEYECEACGTTYWKPSELAFRSLIFPSWGDFLMGHYAFACFEVLGYLVGLAAFGLAAVAAANQGGGDGLIGAVVTMGLFFFFAHVVDAAVTYTVAKKGLYPRGKPTKTDDDDE